MPRSNKESDIFNEEAEFTPLTIDNVVTFANDYKSGLTFDFEMTHLSHFANLLNKVFGLVEESEKITSTELLQTIYDDLSGPYFENKSAETFISELNSYSHLANYDRYISDGFSKIEEKNSPNLNSIHKKYFLAGTIVFAALGLTAISLGVSATTLPGLLATFSPMIGAIAGSFVGGIRIKKIKAKAKAKIFSESEKLPAQYKGYLNELSDETEQKLKALTAANDDQTPILELDTENGIERLRFSHHKAPKLGL